MAIVDYETEGLGPPILTVEEAFERSSFFEVPSYMYPAQVGNFSKGMSEADHKILSAEVLLIFSLLLFVLFILCSLIFVRNHLSQNFKLLGEGTNEYHA